MKPAPPVTSVFMTYPSSCVERSFVSSTTSRRVNFRPPPRLSLRAARGRAWFSAELRLDDRDQAGADAVRLVLRRRLDHHPDERLRAARSQQHPPAALERR